MPRTGVERNDEESSFLASAASVTLPFTLYIYLLIFSSKPQCDGSFAFSINQILDCRLKGPMAQPAGFVRVGLSPHRPWLRSPLGQP